MNLLAGNEVLYTILNCSNILNVTFFFLDGTKLPVNLRQKVYSNGTLTIEEVQRQTDAGTYTCQAKNHHGHLSRRDVEIQILSMYWINTNFIYIIYCFYHNLFQFDQKFYRFLL